MEKILVTGAGGFVGGHLVTYLQEQGYEVIGVDINAPTTEKNFRPIDIRNQEHIRELLDQIRPKFIFHAAAQTSVTESMRLPKKDVETNVLASINLALQSAEFGVKRFIFFSSGGALYGNPSELPVSEDTEIKPLSIYGTSKAATENYLNIIQSNTNLECSVLRPANIYGPGQNPFGEAGVVAIFTEKMLRGEQVTIFGNGQQSRDYIYVEDVTKAALASALGAPNTCNIGSGIETTTQNIFELIAKQTSYQLLPIYENERPGEVDRIALDYSKATAQWNWKPTVTLEEGIHRTVEWFRKQ
ncbi:MAG: UDP-glucose 4-epimerase [Chloroflexi bacterium]|nr:UDP-glucose 4-epimerase [Chloroflexota bacterium]|tara:strand:- start:412 stop:1314 length:903 start_codon:yes stop_codon:yes gene_type:complete